MARFKAWNIKSSFTIVVNKGLMWHAVYACIYCIALYFQSNYIGYKTLDDTNVIISKAQGNVMQ